MNKPLPFCEHLLDKKKVCGKNYSSMYSTIKMCCPWITPKCVQAKKIKFHLDKAGIPVRGGRTALLLAIGLESIT